MNSAATEVAYITSSAVVRECHISAAGEKLSRRAVLHRVVGRSFVRNCGIFRALDDRSRSESSQIRLEYSTSVSRNFTAAKLELQLFVNNSCYFTNNGSDRSALDSMIHRCTFGKFSNYLFIQIRLNNSIRKRERIRLDALP